MEIEGGLWLALVRASWDASLLSVFGTLMFRAVVLPRAVRRAAPDVSARVEAGLRRCAWGGLGAACVLLPVWLWLQAGEIAGAAGWGAAGVVASDTVFGRLLTWQAGLLLVTAVGLWLRWQWASAVGAALLLALQAAHGHALAQEDGPSLLLLAGVVHVLAAGAWLGGLLPLLLVVRWAPAGVGAAASRWFSPMGKLCVWAMVGSAVVQGWALVGSVPGAVGTAYGLVALLKAGLFVVLFGFAVANRYWLAPRLRGPAGERGKAGLVCSVAVQAGFGLLVVGAASVLASLPPSVHEQPVWPFALRPSLVALSDPDLRAEVMRGLAELAAGLVLLAAAAVVWRRFRWAALAGLGAGLVVGSASAAHLGLLLVEAYPTSYDQSPTGFAATSIMEGRALYAADCVACHGVEGRGDGPAAAGLAVPPADLTAGHLWEHSDGEMFWWVSHGIEGPDGALVMPGFAGQLTEDQRWALIDAVRAHNAGVAMQETGRWPVPVGVPGFTVTCADGRSETTEELRGQVLLLVVPRPGEDAGPVPGAQVVVLGEGAAPAGTCLASDPAVRGALSVLTGVSGLAGMEVLVDGNGWLRAVRKPGEAPWTAAALQAEIAAARTHPLAAAEGGHAHHH